MGLKIDQDKSRFKNIIKGKIRKNLKKHITNGELIAKKGKDKISIPIPNISLPRFKFDDQDKGGVGQGDGELGDVIGGEKQPGEGGEAGDSAGEHALEIEVSIEELADILGEELELPNIEPKGKKNIDDTYQKVGGIRRVGPESLKSFKRTYQESLKRMISSGTYDPVKPVILPVNEDKRFRSWKTVEQPTTNAVIIYMMDVSGSMGDMQKEIARILSFWIDTWLNRHYKNLETRFIIHDAAAKEVDRETFFTTRESGGTIISSAFHLCKQIMEADYPANEWNQYLIQATDGDNWSASDNEECVNLLRSFLLPCSNMFAYAQITSPFGSGEFLKVLQNNFEDEPKLITSMIETKNDIVPAIQTFLGKGY